MEGKGENRCNKIRKEQENQKLVHNHEHEKDGILQQSAVSLEGSYEDVRCSISSLDTDSKDSTESDSSAYLALATRFTCSNS